mmetsp:Transcript_26050/g.102321  ORF Transcript_26050/g.102321 Transcript_26050/m.102321 type:complete len:87 (-) Transcript_26050:1550-1810(-)
MDSTAFIAYPLLQLEINTTVKTQLYNYGNATDSRQRVAKFPFAPWKTSLGICILDIWFSLSICFTKNSPNRVSTFASPTCTTFLLM